MRNPAPAGFRVSEILAATGAELRSGNALARLEAVSTDTRTIAPGRLFVALSGERFDGNDYAAEAAARGASALLVSRAPSARDLPAGLPVLVHPDPRRALGSLAAWHRSRLSIPVVGITGTAGKTTTKNILLELLGTRLSVVGSEKSFNNDIGVPLTLLAAGPATEALVVEIGTNSPGEIAALCAIARPTVGVVTCVGHAHLERLGSLEGVAWEKGALPESLPAEGDCVLNADCRFLEQLSSRTHARVSTFSVENKGDLVASEVCFHGAGTTFRLRGRELTSPLLGTHNVHNLLAALLVCERLGLVLEDLLPAVTRLRGGRQRLERRELEGLTLFDDSYNANPESAQAAVRVLAGQHGAGRRVLVFGDMLELGALAAELHHEIGQEAARRGLDLVVLVGDLTRATAAGALQAGMAPEQVLHFDGTAEAARALPGLLHAGDVVLLKASRRMAFERLVESIEARFGARNGGSHAPRGLEACAR